MSVASVAVMIVMVGQVVRQEISKNSLRVAARDKATEISTKEKKIIDLKSVLQGLRVKLLSMTQLTEEMRTKKEGIEKEKSTLQGNITSCNAEKVEAEKKKVEATENLSKLKSEHEQAKQTAQKTIQDLKQKNLDRENAICAVIDTTNAEARKLCGLQ